MIFSYLVFPYYQIYLVSAITLFAFPNVSVLFNGFFIHLTLPFMLPVAHIGMVKYSVVSLQK